MGRNVRDRTSAERIKKITDSARARIIHAIMLPENAGQVQETIPARERLANLFLTFTNHPGGLSFKTIRKRFGVYYSGNEESARRKFMRDINDLEKLGLRLAHYPPNAPMQNGAIAKEHIYVPEIRPEYMPDLQLSTEEAGVLATVLIGSIVRMRKEKNPSVSILESAMCRLLYKRAPELSFEKGPGRAPARIHLQDDATFNNLIRIHRAVQERSLLEFLYGHGSVKTLRRVEGRGLIQNREKWCLVGYDRNSGEIRHFYTDRIADLKICEEKFQPDADFNIRDYSLHPLSLKMHAPIDVVVTVREEGTERLGDLLSGLPKKMGIEMFASGAKFSTTNLQALFSWMMRNPGVVTALAPESVKNGFVEYLETIRGYYR
jgi:predicted DNA-binding transcriptional regulator YafY